MSADHSMAILNLRLSRDHGIYTWRDFLMADSLVPPAQALSASRKKPQTIVCCQKVTVSFTLAISRTLLSCEMTNPITSGSTEHSR
jgi:hypothetical protein